MYRIQLDDVSTSTATNPRQERNDYKKTTSSWLSLHKHSFRKMKGRYYAHLCMVERFDAGYNKLHLKQILFSNE